MNIVAQLVFILVVANPGGQSKTLIAKMLKALFCLSN